MKPANLELHIEQLVLRGFEPGDRYRIGEAVERELTRLFVEQGKPSSLAESYEVANLDGGAFEVATGAKPEVIGVQVGQAVYGGLSE